MSRLNCIYLISVLLNLKKKTLIILGGLVFIINIVIFNK